MRAVTVQGRRYYRIEASAIKSELLQLLPAGQPTHITLHWTAGAYHQPYAAYQVLVADDYILVSANLLHYSMHQHTWRRNGGNLGVCFMAMAGATERNHGRFPITPKMVERAALVVGMLQHRYQLPWANVVDHAHWAQVDGYPGQRWDARAHLSWEGETADTAVIRKARWYASKL